MVTTEDIRWRRRDIKSVDCFGSQYGQKMIARRAGADDAWMVESGKVTEGSSSNAYILTREGLVTRSLGYEISGDHPRGGSLRLARTSSLQIEERPFHWQRQKKRQRHS